MHDRVPGAPGQYQAIISAEDLQKLQNGERFFITMQRDDQPVREGTPYSKAAVLPDSVAAAICPQIDDPTPADALMALARLAKWAGSENLLDNTDFTNPFNQRGLEKYTGKSQHTVDRWRATSQIEFSVNSDGKFVELKCAETASGFNGVSQHLPLNRVPKPGTKITAAFQDYYGGVYVVSGISPEYGGQTDLGKDNSTETGWYVRLSYEAEYANFVLFLAPGKILDLKWIAFYAGEYAAETLPEYQPKEYCTELLECQRYYWKPGTISGVGYSYSTTTAYVSIVCPVEMRIKPTMTVGEDAVITIRTGGQKYSEGITVTGLYKDSNQLRLQLNISGTGIPANSALSVMITGGALEFSADL